VCAGSVYIGAIQVTVASRAAAGNIDGATVHGALGINMLFQPCIYTC